jgi:hypothetical protein
MYPCDAALIFHLPKNKLTRGPASRKLLYSHEVGFIENRKSPPKKVAARAKIPHDHCIAAEQIKVVNFQRKSQEPFFVASR